MSSESASSVNFPTCRACVSQNSRYFRANSRETLTANVVVSIANRSLRSVTAVRQAVLPSRSGERETALQTLSALEGDSDAMTIGSSAWRPSHLPMMRIGILALWGLSCVGARGGPAAAVTGGLTAL